MLDEKDIELLRNLIKDTVDKTVTEMMSKPLPSVETVASVESELPKKRGRPPKKKVDKPEEVDIIEEPVQQESPRRVRRIGEVNNPRRKHGNPKGAQARIEPMNNKNRPNLFLKSDIAKQFKGDTNIDKKLWGSNEPSVRRQVADLVEVPCRVCGDYYEIPSSLVLMDVETHEVSFTCDNCIRNH